MDAREELGNADRVAVLKGHMIVGERCAAKGSTGEQLASVREAIRSAFQVVVAV